MTFVLTVRDIFGLIALGGFLLVMAGWLAQLGWWRMRDAWSAWWRRRTLKQIGDALERDIAAAEARGVKVDRTERMAPRKRIRF